MDKSTTVELAQTYRDRKSGDPERLVAEAERLDAVLIRLLALLEEHEVELVVEVDADYGEYLGYQLLLRSRRNPAVESDVPV